LHQKRRVEHDIKVPWATLLEALSALRHIVILMKTKKM
jgi:hypothetical protein